MTQPVLCHCPVLVLLFEPREEEDTHCPLLSNTQHAHSLPSVPALILVHIKDAKGGRRVQESSGISVYLTTEEDVAFQLRCWLDLSTSQGQARLVSRGGITY